MLRAASVLLGLVLLTGMSREQVLQQMDGNWQATSDDDNWTTASSFVFDADQRVFSGDLAGNHYEGQVVTLMMIGNKAVLTFDDHFSVLVYWGGDDAGTLVLSINGKGGLIYRKVGSAP